jgi:hypothetical protein
VLYFSSSKASVNDSLSVPETDEMDDSDESRPKWPKPALQSAFKCMNFHSLSHAYGYCFN